MVIERVLVERHARGWVVVVDAPLGIKPLLPALRFGRLQRLIGDPEQVRILLDVHSQVLRVLEHIRDSALEVVLRPHVFARRLLAGFPADVGDHRHIHHVAVSHRAVCHVLLEVLQLAREGVA